ncbi:hypothetical protein SAMN05446589_5535 [Streptomyces sp. OV198]|nr:hypothetical protein SAMN05446589_5535 [Streptomyces sp. OV198]
MLRRRLARDYETLPTISESMIYIASIDNLTKLIMYETTPTWRGTYWGHTRQSTSSRFPLKLSNTPRPWA